MTFTGISVKACCIVSTVLCATPITVNSLDFENDAILSLHPKANEHIPQVNISRPLGQVFYIVFWKILLNDLYITDLERIQPLPFQDTG